MLLDVISVEPLSEYKLKLKFENDEIRIFDMKSLLEKNPFTILKDWNLYKMVRVENGTIVWPGDIDIASETLYDRSILECTEK
jgi:hypothetical protein